MVQVQSTWFPVIDRNPQKFVPNIFLAQPSDFMRRRSASTDPARARHTSRCRSRARRHDSRLSADPTATFDLSARQSAADRLAITRCVLGPGAVR